MSKFKWIAFASSSIPFGIYYGYCHFQNKEIEQKAKLFFTENKLHTKNGKYDNKIFIHAPYGVIDENKKEAKIYKYEPSTSFIKYIMNNERQLKSLTYEDDEMKPLIEFIDLNKEKPFYLKNKFYEWHQIWTEKEMDENNYGNINKLSKFIDFDDLYEKNNQKEQIDYFVGILKLVIFFEKMERKYGNKGSWSNLDSLFCWGLHHSSYIINSYKSIGIVEPEFCNITKLITPIGMIYIKSPNDVYKDKIKERLQIKKLISPMDLSNKSDNDTYLTITKNLDGASLEESKFIKTKNEDMTKQKYKESEEFKFWEKNKELIYYKTMKDMTNNEMSLN